MTDKCKVSPVAAQRYLGKPAKHSFRELAGAWKYIGFPKGIEFSFIRPVFETSFVETATRLLSQEYNAIEDAAEYFGRVLKNAKVGNSIIYTLGGWRDG